MRVYKASGKDEHPDRTLKLTAETPVVYATAVLEAWLAAPDW